MPELRASSITTETVTKATYRIFTMGTEWTGARKNYGLASSVLYAERSDVVMAFTGTPTEGKLGITVVAVVTGLVAVQAVVASRAGCRRKVWRVAC